MDQATSQKGPIGSASALATSDASTNSTNWIQVGSIVRAPLDVHNPSKTKATYRAVIATINSQESTVSLICENPIPKSLFYSSPGASHGAQERFLITPNPTELSSSTKDTKERNQEAENQEEQDHIPVSKLSPLFTFELETHPPSFMPSAKWCKTNGDALLQIKDYASALSWYEKALSLTSQVQIGGTILFKRKGALLLADVDYIEKRNASSNQLDIVYRDKGEQIEETIHDNEIIMALLQKDTKERLQERILLNLARCLMQLADVIPWLPLQAKEKYRKSAILTCTSAITCHTFHANMTQHDSQIISMDPLNTQEKARFIRAKLYLSFHKFHHAKADIAYILRHNPNHTNALQLQLQINRTKRTKQKMDKRLAVEMCRWLENVTDGDSMTIQNKPHELQPQPQLQLQPQPQPHLVSHPKINDTVEQKHSHQYAIPYSLPFSNVTLSPTFLFLGLLIVWIALLFPNWI